VPGARSANSLAGYEDAEAGAHAPRRSAATSSAATVAPPLPAAIGRNGTANRWGGSLLQRKIQREREAAIWGGGEARKQGAPRSRTGSARNHQESELFSRSGRGEGERREGEKQVGGKRQAMLCSLAAAAAARLLALVDFVGF